MNYLEYLREQCSQRNLTEEEKEMLIDLCKQTIKDSVAMCLTNEDICKTEVEIIESVYNIIDNIK